MVVVDDLPSWKVHKAWREQFAEEKEQRAITVIQLCIDMTGYNYNFDVTDLKLLIENDNESMSDKISQAPLQVRDFFEDGKFMTNLQEFFQHIIVQHWKELLNDNKWFNISVKFIMLLCASTHDEYSIVGSLIGTILVQNLCAARANLLNDIERAYYMRDAQRKNMLGKKQHYIDQICLTLFPSVEKGFKYSKLSPFLMERVCDMLTSYPNIMVISYNKLELLTAGLQWKNRKNIQMALTCLQHLADESFSSETVREVGLYILKSDVLLMQIVNTFKQFELCVLQLFLQAHGLIGSMPFCAETADLIVRLMFSSNENVLNAAIDLHVLYYTAICPPADVEQQALLALLDTFSRYAYTLSSFETVVNKLWLKGFFRRFDRLFDLLLNTINSDENGFILSSIVQTINFCHQILMEDIKTKILPSSRPSKSVSWGCIKKRIQSFVKGYPKCLAKVSRHPDLYNLMLNCLNPLYNELYSVAGVNCEAYYVDVLYNTLSKVALHGKTYSILFHTLTAIYSFDSIVHVSEDIWNELTETYYTFFFHTRSRLRRYNLGIDKKLKESYTTAITRLCVLIEINNTSENVCILVEYLANDLMLLEKMKLLDESIAIFYRLYKNTLYGVVKYCLQDPSKDCPVVKSQLFAKRFQTLMCKLIERLDCDEDEFDVAMHIANTVCNMLVLTQQHDGTLLIETIPHMETTSLHDVLQKLTKYVERHVFSKSIDADDNNYLLSRRLTLATYNELYRLHASLPKRTDTWMILKHYVENTLFAKELEQLLDIVFTKDRCEFYNITATIIMEYCKNKIYSNNVKNFFTKIHSFKSKQLPEVDEEDYLFNIIQCIVDRILEQIDESNVVLANKFGKIFTIMKPWVIRLSRENLKALNRFIRLHPNISSSMEDDQPTFVTQLKGFQKFLKNS
ncbi:uncharacterized protein LOC128723938 [Anopheles nili]|uniref:uncharacterized protein LOC128723938 n=1 Tax=Anopheles nili TaxID=185578 RepID=UPI00237B5916|nr:uncharacterized protein LOC128723938 [Anopheles nili]